MFSVIAAVGNAHLKCIGEACVRRYITAKYRQRVGGTSEWGVWVYMCGYLHVFFRKSASRVRPAGLLMYRGVRGVRRGRGDLCLELG